MSEQIELYAPKPGSLPWRIVKHLQEQPAGTELARRAISHIFDVDNTSGLDAILQLACARSVLVKSRNGHGEVVWKLGSVECILASTRPVEETPAAREEEPMAVPASAAGKWSPSAPRVLTAAVPRPTARMVPEPVADVAMVKHDTTESLQHAFAEVFGNAAEVEQPTQAEADARGSAGSFSSGQGSRFGPVVLVGSGGVGCEPGGTEPNPAPSATSPTAPQRKPKRGTAPSKPRPAAKPYLAKIEPQPLADPSRREAERYAAWLAEFNVGHSAVFRLAHMKVVEGAASAFAARTKTRFRIAKLSQYRAGIERTA